MIRMDPRMLNPDGMMPMPGRGMGANMMAPRMQPMLAPSPNAPKGMAPRLGLFGGLANLARRGLGNFMAIDPQTRMMMGAGMMEGGLPGLARGYMSGQEAMQGREDRAFQLAERERQAAERAQAEADRQAFFASVPEQFRSLARVAPAAVSEAMLREPPAQQDMFASSDGVIFNRKTGEIIYQPPAATGRLARPRPQATGPATATLPRSPTDLVWGQ